MKNHNTGQGGKLPKLFGDQVRVEKPLLLKLGETDKSRSPKRGNTLLDILTPT
jgi:hypothetical protein